LYKTKPKGELTVKSVNYVILVISLIILHVNVINAQYEREEKEIQVNIFGGLSIPMGDFGTSEQEKEAGYALVGFSAGFGFIHHAQQNFNWIVDFYLSFNAFNEEVLQVQIGNSVNVDAGTYVNTWILTGFRGGADIAPSVKLFAFAEAGLLIASVPDITYSTSEESIEQTTDMGIAPALGLGAGININSYTISIRYLSGKAEHEQTIKIGNSTGTTDVKLPVAILQLILAINL